MSKQMDLPSEGMMPSAGGEAAETRPSGKIPFVLTYFVFICYNNGKAA